MRSEQDVNETIDAYANMIQRICLCHLKNYADMEDIFQNVFIKYMLYDKDFTSEAHKKAWLLRVASNACKDYFRTSFWKRKEPLDDHIATLSSTMDEDHLQVLEAVRSLPDKYKDVIYLHYYEGFQAAEIGEILGKKENTVYSLLSRGRVLLKKTLGGE